MGDTLSSKRLQLLNQQISTEEYIRVVADQDTPEAERDAAWSEVERLLADVERRYTEALQLYTSVRDQRVERAFEDDEQYWQGKKDGIRSVLALMAPDPEDRERWQRILESSQ